MTKAAIAAVDDIDRPIFCSTRDVTIITWAYQSHVTGSDMIDITVRRRIGRMAIQTIGRIGACSYGVNYLLPRTVMTGFTGAWSVGGHIVFGAVDFTPSRHNVTAAARRTTGQVSGSQSNSMVVAVMGSIP